MNSEGDDKKKRNKRPAPLLLQLDDDAAGFHARFLANSLRDPTVDDSNPTSPHEDIYVYIYVHIYIWMYIEIP